MISASLMVAEDLKTEWSLDASRVIALRHIPTLLASKAPAQEGAAVKELVFMNEMSVEGGLQSFCDAIDLIAHYPEMVKVTITFMGAPGQVHGMSSKDYIELRSLNWDAYDIKWEIKSDSELLETVDYLRALDAGRVAVLPSLFDSSAIIEQELLNAGVSFIGSIQSAVVSLLDEASRKKMLSSPQGLELSHKIMEYVRHGCMFL
jgi:hypothetical protein